MRALWGKQDEPEQETAERFEPVVRDPLPVKAVGPFVAKPRCGKCGFLMIDWRFQPGYHGGCSLGYVGNPFGWWGPVEVNKARQAAADWAWATAPYPEHIDLECLRCHHKWASSTKGQTTEESPQ